MNPRGEAKWTCKSNLQWNLDLSSCSLNETSNNEVLLLSLLITEDYSSLSRENLENLVKAVTRNVFLQVIITLLLF